MNAGLIVFFVLTGVGLLISAYQHDKPKEGKHNFWASIISYVLQYAILYWAGLFDNL